METIALEGWALARGAVPNDYRPIAGPMTVAAALRARGEWSFEKPILFDDETWWFRAELPPVVAGDVLRLDGLATLAEVFIDRQSVLRSDNMYHTHVVELPLGARELSIRFDPLTAALAQKRPRPRWKTRLTSHQQLRWIRTSLVGRMPGWSPPVAPVGPWRGVVVERHVAVARASAVGTDTDRDIARYLNNASALAAVQPGQDSARRVAQAVIDDPGSETPTALVASPRIARTVIDEAAAPRVGLLTGTLPSLPATGENPALDFADSGALETVRELAPPAAAIAAAGESSARDQSTATLRGFTAEHAAASAADAPQEPEAESLRNAPTLKGFAPAAVDESLPTLMTEDVVGGNHGRSAPRKALLVGTTSVRGPNTHLATGPAPRVHTVVEGSLGVVFVASPTPGIFVIGDQRVALARTSGEFTARVEIPDVELWWPHTHGTPKRHVARLERAEGVTAFTLAFRAIALDTTGGGFQLSLNGLPIFCRGAVWTSLDVATLTSTAAEYARALATVKDAGMNMLRLSGTLFYEDDAFYEACDALGILVWQDFMFANMDYPIGDDAFRGSVEREARQFLERIQSRACIALLCGGSEVEQQAAMFGADRAIWRSPLFSELLPAICAELRPDVPYWPSSPAGGALPFHVNEGASHYYGVGAYLRPFEDARRANVRFASECLAFANIPEDDLFPAILADGEAPFVSARWKERTSKDFGASWDFEDVRDHYVERLFGVSPARVRYEDVERYLALSRVASGETMARVLAEFRRTNSTTAGALIWFLQDLWPGAGWGILDARGEPKSAYWYCKRALAPRAVFFTDEGSNGLHVHVINDRAEPLEAKLDVTLYRDGETRTNGGRRDMVVEPRGRLAVPVDALFDHFADSAYAYRFGPPGHDVAIATLQGVADVSSAAWLVDFAKPPAGGGLEGTLTTSHVTVRTKRFAHAVRIAVPGYSPADNYFDLAPGEARTIPLRPIPSAKKRSLLSGQVSALNVRSAVSLKVESG